MEGHVISFDWDGFHPNLIYHDVDNGKLGNVDIWNLDLEVSSQAICVGSWSNGSHVPCETSQRVTSGSICQDCASDFLPDLGCMFEPRCNGELCDVEFCSREHVVYMAFHGRIAKVGMTSSNRLEQRMVEQGCDAYTVVSRVQGRKTARTMESAIADNLAFRQRIRPVESLASLTETVPVSEIEMIFGECAEKLESFGHRSLTLKWLEGYPITLPLKEMPREVKVAGKHLGKAIGIKGKFMVYENEGLKAVNLQRLPGRFITTARAPPSKPLECWL